MEYEAKSSSTGGFSVSALCTVGLRQTCECASRGFGEHLHLWPLRPPCVLVFVEISTLAAYRRDIAARVAAGESHKSIGESLWLCRASETGGT